MPRLPGVLSLPASLRKLLRYAAIALGLLLALLLYVLVIGVSVDASGQRARIAGLLAQSLGREVHFDGPMQLEISARPGLRLGGLTIANAPGFSGNEFASLGEARLKLNLWALLAGRMEIEKLSGSQVRAHLQVNAAGNNWTFKPASAPRNEPAQAGNTDIGALLARLDIERIALENLEVDFTPANGRSHSFELQTLEAHFPVGKPLTLSLHGSVEKQYPYRLDLTGGTLAELARLEQPWPLDLKLEFMSSRLALNGSFSKAGATINFGLGTEHFREFAQLLQTSLPPVGLAGISGTVKYTPGKVVLEDLSGVLGNTTLEGNVALDFGGARPRLQGALSVPVLDLRPFLTGKPATQEAPPPKSFAEIYRELAQASFSMDSLNDADVDLSLAVGRWLSLPGDVRDTLLQVKLAHGRLQMPVHANVAGVDLSGSAVADASVAPARFKLALGTHNSHLGNLAGVLFGLPGVEGELGRFDLRIAARGSRGAELMESLDVQLDVEHGELSYGNASGGKPVHFTLDDLELALAAGKPMHGGMRGTLLDTPFSATLQGGVLAAMMHEGTTPLDFRLQAGSAHVQLGGMLRSDGQNSTLDFELAAPHSSEVAQWLGLKPGVDVPVSVRGNVHAGATEMHLENLAVQIGKSDLNVDLQRTLDGKGKALISLKLAAGLIDADQLQALLPESKPAKPSSAPAAQNLIDIPVLPGGINLADADIVVRVQRVASKSPIALRDIRFDGRIRDGMMFASPFAANVAEHDFRGAIMLDLRSQEPHSTVWLAADSLDIGRILGKLGIGNIDAGVGHISLQLDMHSSRLGELLAQSDMALSLDGGHLGLRDANTGNTMQIALDKGELRSRAGAPVYLELYGALDAVPVFINIKTAKAVDLINPTAEIPFRFTLNAAGAALQFAGDIDRPFTKKDIELALDMSGIRLNDLDRLAHTALPPWGPWAASGKFHMTAGGYEVSALALQVGSSQLTGFGRLNTQATPPRIDAALTAPAIQLDDFKLGDGTAEKSKTQAKPAAAKSKSKAELREQAGKSSNQAQQMLSREVLRRQDAYLVVRVGQVLSGRDMLGSGELDAKLENGRADIASLVHTPGGSASFKLGYEPGEHDVAADLRIAAKHFDYGVLVRRNDPKNEMRGTFTLDVDVSARAPMLSDLLRYGKGHIDFVVWPQNLKSGLLDVWAVNVLMALLPAVDESNTSKVNCAIGRFVLKDGVLSDKSILIDTSRMRVKGEGSVNFASEKINLYVQPKAKKPQFLSFALPIELSGTFDEFHVGVRPADVLAMTGQLVTSVVWVPLMSLFGHETPADGRDVCLSSGIE